MALARAQMAQCIKLEITIIIVEVLRVSAGFQVHVPHRPEPGLIAKLSAEHPVLQIRMATLFLHLTFLVAVVALAHVSMGIPTKWVTTVIAVLALLVMEVYLDHVLLASI